MRRHRVITIHAAVLSVLMLLVSGCGSFAVDRLMAVADAGLDLAVANDRMLVASLQKQIHADVERLNAGVDRDIELVASGQMKSSDGQPIILDAEWVKQMRLGYGIALEAKHKQLRELDAVEVKLERNLQSVQEIIRQARELNAGYLRSLKSATGLLDRTEKLARQPEAASL
jgi:hypothetical protein